MIGNDDIQVQVTIKDQAGVPLTISALNAVEVYIYIMVKGSKTLKATYKKGNSGYYGITTVNDSGGIIEIILNRQLTRGLPEGKIYLETKVQLSASSSFISSLQNVGAPGVEIDTNEMTANNNTLL
jgi:hypothetical protein